MVIESWKEESELGLTCMAPNFATGRARRRWRSSQDRKGKGTFGVRRRGQPTQTGLRCGIDRFSIRWFRTWIGSEPDRSDQISENKSTAQHVDKSELIQDRLQRQFPIGAVNPCCSLQRLSWLYAVAHCGDFESPLEPTALIEQAHFRRT
jgi:hypothetical protein